MMSSIFRDEFQQNFNNFYPNIIYDNIIRNNFFDFSNILPMNRQNIYNAISQKISDFKNKYKGIFVNNFYFLLLFLSRCPLCGKLFGIHGFKICPFFQLEVPNQVNNINDLITEYFNPITGYGDYHCKECGCQGAKFTYKYCLNLPIYLFLKFEGKNKIDFSDIIKVPLFNGSYYNYQFYACIFKHKINDIASFEAVLNAGNGYYLYSDDKVIPFSSNISLDCPSLALYKRISF